MWISSLIPRPSHRPAFAVCKNGGGRPGVIYHVNDVSVYQVDRGGGGVPERKDAFHAGVLHFEPRAIRFSLCERLKPQRLGQKLARSLEGGPLLPLCLPW